MDLSERQAWPLEEKILQSEMRIREWYEHWKGKVYVSFSGGKDSTVLLHLVRSIFPDVPAVFVDTGLEFPEIKEFVRTFENVVTLRPKMGFRQVIEKYGYPVISKEQACAISRYRNTKDPVQKYRRLNGWPNGKKGMISKKWQFMVDAPFKISDACCDIMKKNPMDKYAKETGRKPIMGMMAGESRQRGLQYRKTGCNAFDGKKGRSWPIAFWTEADILEYARLHGVEFAPPYAMGYKRTGCVFCMFGVHLEGRPNRFDRLKETHPKLWGYCMDNLGIRDVLGFIESGKAKESEGQK